MGAQGKDVFAHLALLCGLVKPAYRAAGRGWFRHVGWRHATRCAIRSADRSIDVRPRHIVHGANLASAAQGRHD